MIWTRKQLEEQRDEILSEFNFHTVLDFCTNLVENDPKLKFIDYKSIAQIREEAKKVLNNFIDYYLERNDGSYHLYSNGKWDVCMSLFYDAETPLMTLAFRFQVGSEIDAAEWAENYQKNKNIKEN